ncbi:hypothetical protein TIFTF001_000941 [Ficus carica]|uniref:Uncharacterized protein n=1 Tax=Ficus carica TaxID=3494 RepID=A0AA88CP31_FICCA|nr:hypothetical protein TIFTF001_000941 [Ficus carica]
MVRSAGGSIAEGHWEEGALLEVVGVSQDQGRGGITRGGGSEPRSGEGGIVGGRGDEPSQDRGRDPIEGRGVGSRSGTWVSSLERRGRIW